MALRTAVRQAVFERDGYVCRYCGRKITELRHYNPYLRRWIGLIHVDHVVPRSRGGGDEMDNLVTACQGCNLAKYDKVGRPNALAR